LGSTLALWKLASTPATCGKYGSPLQEQLHRRFTSWKNGKFRVGYWRIAMAAIPWQPHVDHRLTKRSHQPPNPTAEMKYNSDSEDDIKLVKS
jgi:hypothetical protein